MDSIPVSVETCMAQWNNEKLHWVACQELGRFKNSSRVYT